MAKKKKTARPKARLPKGLRDVGSQEMHATAEMLTKIRAVYERYGFEPLETPAFEYTEALGKFLPDVDRPNAGVFSFQDDDDQWLSLRYDLTAPLARHVAENFDALPRPFRRYATGYVWRNEKPGPGRFRQFMQFDADTVGTENVAADAEICMLAADTLEALGIARGDFVVKVNNRKLLDGVLASIGIGDEADDGARRLTVLRAADKLDRLGPEGVALLLGPGRKDDSGDFTKGAGLAPDEIDRVMRFVGAQGGSRAETLEALKPLMEGQEIGLQGLQELGEIDALLTAGDFDVDRVTFDPSVVRGLDYYTGPVFEAELLFSVAGDDGEMSRFGSVGGGGRYDDLVTRFTGRPAPATGFSIGVSRLQAALAALGRAKSEVAGQGPVVVLVMDREDTPRYQRMAMDLREAGIRAEMYLGVAGMKAQMKYADKRGAPCVVIQGSQEREAGEVQIKDLIEGLKLSETIKDSKEWREARPAQVSVPEVELVAAVRDILARHRS
ncbi:MAG: histidine--tRNA ligase [Hyphomicrobiaceae bacterium]